MAEPKRIIEDEKITTADLAERAEKNRETERRPSLLRDERRTDLEAIPTSASSRGDESIDPSEQRTPPADAPIQLPRGDGGEVRSTAAAAHDQPTPLFHGGEIDQFRSQWSEVQTGFVDEPRRAVKDADNLVASLMQKLAEGFATERELLEKQWDRGVEVSTEDLRVALQRYRSFFDRLLRV